MKDWLARVLAQAPLGEGCEGYLLGRGATPTHMDDLGLREWVDPGPSPDPVFNEEFGDDPDRGIRGLSRLRGKLVYPLWGPTGRLLGIEARSWQGEKRISQYMLPEAKWNPVFIGLTARNMRRIWEGADVAIVEGLFDLVAVDRIASKPEAWAGSRRDCVVLATLRARVTRRHVDFLRRHCRGMVHMVYDNDDTGLKQTHGDPAKNLWGAIRTLERVGLFCEAVRYTGKDPGAVWDSGGEELLLRVFEGRFLARRVHG